MASPINYMIDVADPFKMAMEGFQQGVAVRRQPELEARQKVEQAQADARFRREQVVNSQQDVLFGQAQQDRARALAEMEKQKARGQQMQAAVLALSENPNASAEDYAKVITQFPEISQDLSRGWDALEDAQKQQRLNVLGSAFSALKAEQPSIAIDLLQERHDALIASGRTDDAQHTKALLEILKIDPQKGMTSIGIALRGLGGSDFDGVLGDGQKVRATKIFTNGTVVQSTDNGVRVQTADGKTLDGDAAMTAVQVANEEEIRLAEAGKYAERSGTLGATIDRGGEAKATEAAATEQIRAGAEALKSMAGVRTNISNLDAVISALDNGAKTGAIQRYLPDVTAASVELANLRGRLGIDVIGSVTFGALSEGERQMALDTALPVGMDEVKLRAWAEEKKAAQQKYLAALEETAIFLLNPENTLEDYVKRVNEATAAREKVEEPKEPGLSFMDALGGG